MAGVSLVGCGLRIKSPQLRLATEIPQAHGVAVTSTDAWRVEKLHRGLTLLPPPLAAPLPFSAFIPNTRRDSGFNVFDGLFWYWRTKYRRSPGRPCRICTVRTFSNIHVDPVLLTRQSRIGNNLKVSHSRTDLRGAASDNALMSVLPQYFPTERRCWCRKGWVADGSQRRGYGWANQT